MSELRRLYRYIAPYWRRVAVTLIGLICSSLITLALPYAVQLLVDSVFVEKDYSQLNSISLWLFGLFMVQAIISFSYRYHLQYLAQRTIADLRQEIHRHLLRLSLNFFTHRRVGDLVSRVSNDVTVLQDALAEAPVSLMRQFVTVLGGLALMIWMNWQLTLLILLLMPPVMFVATFYGRRLKRLATDVQDRQADATIVLEEMLSGVRIVKSFVREQYESLRYGEAIEASFDAAIERAKQRAIFVPLISLLGFGGIVLLLWYGGRMVIAGTMTPGELIAYLFYMIFVSGPMAEAANLWGRLQEAAGASRRIFEIMDTEPEPGYQPILTDTSSELAAVPELVEGQGHVRFVDVNFRYHDAQGDALPVVLEEINLEAQPGQVVALVGYSGGGKTTLVNLIPRFYDPQSGQIEIDGVPINQMSAATLRSHIGLVPQESFLFGGTVRENIAYGRLDATEDEIRAATEAAYAHEFIAELPQQYETIVGERGIKLSAGQRQRIAIARALLKDPRILILDEATSALDTESERWVQAALERLMEGRTSFVIAHRLSTIQRADMILVMEKGRIVERGTHEALLELAGVYQRLYTVED